MSYFSAFVSVSINGDVSQINTQQTGRRVMVSVLVVATDADASVCNVAPVLACCPLMSRSLLNSGPQIALRKQPAKKSLQ